MFRIYLQSRENSCYGFFSLIIFVKQIRMEGSSSQSSLAYVVSGNIQDFDPQALPGGILGGIRVHKVAECPPARACDNAEGLVVSNDLQYDPSEEVNWARQLDMQSSDQLLKGSNRLKRIMKALKESGQLQEQVEKKIVQMKDSNKELEETVNKMIGVR